MKETAINIYLEIGKGSVEEYFDRLKPLTLLEDSLLYIEKQVDLSGQLCGATVKNCPLKFKVRISTSKFTYWCVDYLYL